MCKDMISGIAVYLLQLQEFIATLSDCDLGSMYTGKLSLMKCDFQIQ